MSDSSTRIRPAGTDDKEVLADLISSCYRDVADRFDLTAGNCPKHPSNCTASWIKVDFARGARYHLLLLDEEPVGCVAVEIAEAKVAYLERLAIMPANRGRGYGSLLAQHALNFARQEGVETVSIGIIAAQTELKRWYERLGFIEGETKRFDHLPFMVTFMSYSFL